MSGSGKKLIKQWERQAIRQGWRIERRVGRGHDKWWPPDAPTPVSIASSPGRGRSMANTRAQLRRAGLDIA